MGFNDDELQQNERRKNVLILGDSFTEAMQVPRAVNFVSLAAESVPCLRFINSGRSGMALTHFLLMADKFEQIVALDRIVVVLNRWDIEETMQNTGRIEWSEKGEVDNIVHSFRQPHRLRQMTEVLFSNSSLASYLLERLKTFKSASVAKSASPKASNPDNILIKHQQDEDKFLKVASHVFDRLTKIAPVEVIYVPELNYNPDGVAIETAESNATAEMFAQLAASSGSGFRSGGEHLVRSYKETHQPPFGFANAKIHYGHLNPQGHQGIARVMTELFTEACAKQ